MTSARSRATLALVAATVGVSFSAIFIRIADDDAATIVWLRMSMATVLLSPFAIRDLHHGVFPRSHGSLRRVFLSGVLLAGHFLLWTASLMYTSVAASVLLVSLHPVMVAPLGRHYLGERSTARTYVGMALALVGTVITCAGDVRLDSRALLGDLMAIGGAACLAGYLLIGRGIRRAHGVAAYSALVFATVAVVAAALAAATGSAHLPSGRVALLGLALAVVCTIGGHTVYNWALRHVRAVAVSLAFLGEPPLAAVLALALLANVPAATTIVGGSVILAGLGLAAADAGTPIAEALITALE